MRVPRSASPAGSRGLAPLDDGLEARKDSGRTTKPAQAVALASHPLLVIVNEEVDVVLNTCDDAFDLPAAGARAGA